MTYFESSRIQEEFRQYGYGLFAVEIKNANEFIGFIGFHWSRIDLGFGPFPEIGWRLKKEAWGKVLQPREPRNVCLMDSMTWDLARYIVSHPK